jgi:hypothetical protein
VEVYDPVADTFTAVGHSGTFLIANTATALNDGTILFTGGTPGPYGTPPTYGAWVYNPATQVFAATANPMNIARWNHTATLLSDGRVLIAGGQDAGFADLNSAEVYDPVAQTFTLTASPMNFARASDTATLLDDGTDLLAGCDNTSNTSAELFNPAGTFTATGNMSVGRCFFTATLLTNETVLAVGSFDQSSNFKADLYDPVAGAFKATGSMSTGRANFSATRLVNGSVLTVGGSGFNSGPTSIELYTPSTLTPPNLVSVSVTAANPTIAAVGGTERFVATGTFSDSSTHQLASITWSATDLAGTNVATISNDATNPGVAVGLSSGTATITACAGTICGSATLTVGVLTYNQIQSPTSPIARGCGGMAFDPTTNSTLLFGGVRGYYSTLGDTWQLAGGIWSQLTPANSPPAREGPAMAFDVATGTVVLFGGSTGLFGGDCCDLSDTWVWDGTNWTQINTLGPAARRFDGQGMVYDANTGNVILFGGIVQGNSYLGDTWAWNGTSQTWTQLSPAASPSPRGGHAMANDRAGNVVLFGGTNGTNNSADTWVWNGTTWQQQSPVAAPPARSGHAMVFDPDLNEVVLFGGYNFNDTWVWDSTTWTQVTPATSPHDRYSFGMDYDSSAHAAVIFGGFSVADNGPILVDTWELSLLP